MRTGRKQRTSCPTLPKIAIHGNFPLGFDHFISKIMIKNNRQKILPPLARPPNTPPRPQQFLPNKGEKYYNKKKYFCVEYSYESREIHRPERQGVREPRGCRNRIFRLLLTISNFTYEMVKTQGKIAMEGDFRKRRTGCPLLPTRPHVTTILHFISKI